MKKFILTLTTLAFIQCGPSNEQKSIPEIVSQGTLEEIQLQKTKHVKTINQLQDELVLLNEAITDKGEQQKFSLVSSVEIKEENFQHFVSFQGSLETDKNIVLFPEIAGLLKHVYVTEGQKVKKGTVLAEISDSGLKDQLEQLKLQLELAKTTFERQERLWDKKIGSEINFLQAKTQYLSLKKSVSQMKDQVIKTKIIAPFNGIVDHIMADQGSNVSPGMTPIIRIINLHVMKVTAEIPEVHLPNIKVNTPATVSIPVLNTLFEEHVSAVGNFINPNNRSFRIEITMKNKKGNLKPNMTTKIAVNDYQNPTAILVSVKNILENQNGESYVYRLIPENDTQDTFKVVKTFVTLGKSSNSKVEVIEGLQVGDRIVEDGIRLVKDQQIVKNIQA